jgi:hypothetical protein
MPGVSALRPDLIAYLPCPIKVLFEQAIAEYLAQQGSPPIRLQIEGKANKNGDDCAALVSEPLGIEPTVRQGTQEGHYGIFIAGGKLEVADLGCVEVVRHFWSRPTVIRQSLDVRS